MSTEVTTHNGSGSAIMENVLLKGDLSQLNEKDRTFYYTEVCKSVGLNPLTKPFEYIVLNDKLTLYAKRDATDQLRKIHGVSIEITARDKLDGVYVVTARATTKDGRTDESTGAVSLEKEDGEWKQAQNGKRYFAKNGNVIPLKGDDLANALMKAETKAKRRVTLSVCGLGLLDESEIETIPTAVVSAPGSTTDGKITSKEAYGSATAMKDRWTEIRDAILKTQKDEELDAVFVKYKVDLHTLKSIDGQIYNNLVEIGTQRRNAISETQGDIVTKEMREAYGIDDEIIF